MKIDKMINYRTILLFVYLVFFNVFIFSSCTDKSISDGNTIRVLYLEDGRFTVPRYAELFNQSTDEYTVECIEFASENENTNYDTLLSDFDRYLLSGEDWDVIFLYQSADISKYSTKGVFCDLYKIAEKDMKWSFDDIYPCALCIGNSKLYAIMPEFNINTVVCNSQNNPEGIWDIESFVDQYIHNISVYPIVADLDRITMKNWLLNGIDSYYDLKTGECRFNSEGFKGILDFLKSLPELYVQKRDDHDVKPYISGDIKYYEQTYMCSFVDYLNIKARFGFENDISMIGYPSASDGTAYISPSGYLAVSARSNVPKGAWEFIKFILKNNYEVNNYKGMRFFPAFRPALYEWGESEKNLIYCYERESLHCRVYQTNDYSEQISNDIYVITIDDSMIKEVDNFVLGASQKTVIPEKIIQIVEEEIDSFLNGHGSAAKCAELIQNRVSIYLNEIR